MLNPNALRATLAAYDSRSRLYAITLHNDRLDLGASGLLVEAFCADEQLQGAGPRDVIVLSTKPDIDLRKLLGRRATLQVSLANGKRSNFTGYINEASMLGSDGGFTRMRLRLTPWLWRLSQVRNSRVFKDRTVQQIVDELLTPYRPQASWRWTIDCILLLQSAPMRVFCCQYRESDLDFLGRLLTEEGIAWRWEELDDGQGLVLFADSTRPSGAPSDPSSAADGGLRYHGAYPGEQSDTIQSLSVRRHLSPMLNSVASYDYKTKQTICARAPSRVAAGGRNAPHLESYDTPGAEAYDNPAQAERYCRLQMEAIEARTKLWSAHTTVRTLRPGTRFTLLRGPLHVIDQPEPEYVVLRVRSVGLNNLPAPASAAFAELFGPVEELLDEQMAPMDLAPETLAVMLAEAKKSGYANHITMLAADRPWRPVLGENGLRLNARPTAHGCQSAFVCAPNGDTVAVGAGEMACDYMGRVWIRFPWQQDGGAACLVRVAQRSAGGGMGSHFFPRIGQEVLVMFLDDDIDRPIVVGAFYNGNGTGCEALTPGGKRLSEKDNSVFETALDHCGRAQDSLNGGHSPVWHGSAGWGHRHRGNIIGYRTKEFGKNGWAAGYNQLLFDDTDAEGRIQLRSSSAATELNLGHLIHTADNYRGSFRGQGAELRTDDYGAVRGAGGLLISSYKVLHNRTIREPAGDNGPGMTLLKQAVMLAESFNKAAVTHQTVGLASHLGGAKPNFSVLNDKAAPLKALQVAASGMLSSESFAAAKAERGDKPTKSGKNKVPHTTSPIIAIAARAGLGVVAGQDLQLASGEMVALMSGQDSQFVASGQMRLQTGQAIGMLGGAVQAGADGIGLQLIAALQAIELQAQNDAVLIRARDQVDIISANSHIDWAAAKSISISTMAGANLTIGPGIKYTCPGKILIHSGAAHFIGPDKLAYPLTSLPNSVCLTCLLAAANSGSAMIPPTAA